MKFCNNNFQKFEKSSVRFGVLMKHGTMTGRRSLKIFRNFQYLLVKTENKTLTCTLKLEFGNRLEFFLFLLRFSFTDTEDLQDSKENWQ